jgi:hypothetical protein
VAARLSKSETRGSSPQRRRNDKPRIYSDSGSFLYLIKGFAKEKAVTKKSQPGQVSVITKKLSKRKLNLVRLDNRIYA